MKYEIPISNMQGDQSETQSNVMTIVVTCRSIYTSRDAMGTITPAAM